MESIAYLINRHFTLVAVDTHYLTEFAGIKIQMNQAKKLYKLNDHNLISVIGNPYKITDIFKYVLKLNELGHNGNYDKIVEDLNDVFNTSKTEISKGLRELSDILPRFYNDSGYVKTEELFEYLKDKPEYIAILQDTLSSMNNSHPALTQVLVFGWDTSVKLTRLAHFVSLGQNLTGNQLNEMLPDFVYTRFASATLDPAETTKLESELVQQLTPIVTPGWDIDKEKIAEVIEKGKQVLTEGLKKITPYQIEPNIVFYELSERTNFKFEEPKDDLKKIEYNRT